MMYMIMDIYLLCKNIIAIEKNRRANKTQKTLGVFFFSWSRKLPGYFWERIHNIRYLYNLPLWQILSGLPSRWRVLWYGNVGWGLDGEYKLLRGNYLCLAILNWWEKHNSNKKIKFLRGKIIFACYHLYAIIK